MLPLKSLCIRRSDGMPDEEGQLWTFTDVYCVDVCNTKSPILTMYPLLTGVHVPDENICILPDIFIGKNKTTVQQNESKEEANKWLKICSLQSVEIEKQLSWLQALCIWIIHC